AAARPRHPSAARGLAPRGRRPARPRRARRPRPPRRPAATWEDVPMSTLRRATSEDVEQIVDLVQAAYRGEGGWTTEAHLVEGHRTDAAEVHAMLADPAVTLLVDDEDGRVRGCCY